MIFTFLISIVFLAELIIAIAILLTLKRWSKKVKELDSTVTSLKSSLGEICVLIRKISEQVVEFSEDFVARFKQNQEKFWINQIAKIFLGTVLFRKFKKSKALKFIGKGLSLLEIVV